MSSLSAISLLPQRASEYKLYDDSFFNAFTSRKETATNFPPGVQRVVDGLRLLLGARDMSQLCRTMDLFSKDLVWSTPLAEFTRKGHLRVASYFAHFVADYELQPETAQVFKLPGYRHMVQLDATVWVKPYRTWLFLPSLLLPKATPLRVTYRIGVNGPLESGKIEAVHARLHNLPALPLPVRSYAGVMLGTIPHAAEPLWTPAAAYLAGDEFYKHKMNNVQDEVVNTTTDYVNWSTNTAKDVFNSTLNTAYQVAGSAVDTAQQVVGGVKDTAYQAAGRAQEVTGAAVGTVMGTADAARNATEQVAAGAYDRVADATARASDNAADAAYRARAAANTAAAGTAATAQKTAAVASAPGGEVEHIANKRHVPVTRV